MGLSQLACMFVFFGIAMAYATRAKWMPKVLAKVPGGNRFQSRIGKFGGQEAAELEGEILTGNPTRYFATLQASREGQWDKRCYLAETVGKKIQDGFIAAWAAQQPDMPGLQLIIGFRKVRDGWNARGSGTADEISDQDHADMHVCGEQASQAFARAAATDPADPTPWVGRVKAEHCIQDDAIIQRANGLFAEVMRRDPESYDGIEALLGILSPHWWGKNGEGLATARSLAQGSAPGSRRPAGIILAHLHAWHNLRYFKTVEEATAHMQSPAVIQELRTAHAASLGNPAFRTPIAPFEMYNQAAFAFYLSGQKDLLRYELARIGDNITHWWGRLPNVKTTADGYAMAERWAKS